MATVGYATLQVIPSMRGMEGHLRRELGGLGPAGQRAGESAGKGFSGRFGNAVSGLVRGVGQTLVSGLTAATAAAGGLVAASLFKGWDRLTTIQDATSALTISLGDAGKAAKLLDEVLGVVRGTPFNLDQFAAAAQQLVGFGVDAQKVPHYLTAIGEAAATQGKRSSQMAEQLSTVFGQMAASGQVSLADVWRISDAGVNALAILANHFGKTRDEMKDMISKGAVPAGEALDALAKGILEGSTGLAGTTVALQGTMAGLRDTLSGSFGGFGAAMARFGASILTPFTGALTKGFTAGAALLDKLGERASNWAKSLVDSPGFTRLAKWLTELPDKVGPLISRLSELGPALAPLGAALAALGTSGLAGALGPLGALLPTINPLVAAFVALVATTPELRLAFGDLAAAAAPLAAQLGEDLMVVVTELAKAAIPLLTVAVHALVPPMQLLADNAELVSPALLLVVGGIKGLKIAKSVVGGLQEMSTAIVRVGSSSASAVGGLARMTAAVARGTVAVGRAAAAYAAMAVRAVAAFALTAAAAVASAAAVVAAWLVAAAPFIAVAAAIGVGVYLIVTHWDTLKAATLAAFNAIRDFIVQWWPVILGIFTGGLGLLVGLVVQNWDKIRSTISSVLNTIKSIISGVLGAIQGAWSAAWGALTGIVSGALTAAYSAVSTGLKNITGLVSELPTRILNALGNVASLLFNAGRDLIQGFINGIKSMAGKVGGAVKDVAGGAVNVVKSVFKLGSPSRLFHQFGVWTMEGLAQGIVGSLPLLRGALTQMAQVIAGASPNSALGKYFAHVLRDGDWGNDWLGHLPASQRKAVMQSGANLAAAMGHQPGRFGAEHLRNAGLNNPWDRPLEVKLVVDGKELSGTIVDPMAAHLRDRDRALA